ncbi:MAG: outer membrane lipoprotein carrier protein LolA [Bdellovibrio sp.]|nr:MAG: outer membrane lipoprotein carrier protein LolA [Bdellovibrio sp.]
MHHYFMKFFLSALAALSVLCLVGPFDRVLASESENQPVSKETLKVLRETVLRYQRSPLVEMNVEKKVTFELLGKDRVYHGKVSLAEKRFRFETEDPEKNLILFDGQTLWTVQYPTSGTDGKIQVAKARLDKKNQSKILLSELLTGKALMTQFDFLKEEDQGNVVKLFAKPKKGGDQVTTLWITVNKKEKEVRSVEYSDELGNKTVMTFSDLRLQDTARPKIFSYKPEKNAEVTNF